MTGARSICLDAAATDAEGVEYDIEVQRASDGARPKRARYHSSVMDVENLDAGQEFEELQTTYVIFITEKDVFEKGEPYYIIERTLGSAPLQNIGRFDGDGLFNMVQRQGKCVNMAIQRKANEKHPVARSARMC